MLSLQSTSKDEGRIGKKRERETHNREKIWVIIRLSVAHFETT
jgi:hypothetical protein